MKKILKRTVAHFKNNKKFYFEVGVLTVGLCLTSGVALAGIDSAGTRIYGKLVPIAKWVIIIKGCFEIIQAVLGGDFQSAKSKFFSYLLCFAIILALPWSFNEVEKVFK